MYVEYQLGLVKAGLNSGVVLFSSSRNKRNFNITQAVLLELSQLNFCCSCMLLEHLPLDSVQEWAYSAYLYDKLMMFFLFFRENRLTFQETIYMICQSLFSGKK